MKDTALIVIDVQVCMFSDEKYKVYKGESLLSNIKYLIDQAHNAQVPVIFMQHTSDDDATLQEGSAGWQIHPFIAPIASDIILTKRTPDSFANTSLAEVLKAHNVTKFVICGLQTEYGIDTTCRRAFSLGYDTILVKDAHSTFDLNPLSAMQIIEHHHRIMASWFATVIPTQEIKF